MMQDIEVTFNHIRRKLSIKHIIRINIFKIHKILTEILKIDSLWLNQTMTIMSPKTVKYTDGGHLEKGNIVSLGTFCTGKPIFEFSLSEGLRGPILPTGRKCKTVTTSVCSQVSHTT